MDAVFYPTATPTHAPLTATPSTIADVPRCLTSYFPGEARQYAEVWRLVTEGLSAEEIAAQTELLCQNLTGTTHSSYRQSGYNRNIQVMTVDMTTGMRRLGGYIPPRETVAPRTVDLAGELFWRAGISMPSSPILSPDGRLLAGRTYAGYIQIYRLPLDYDTLAATATATVGVVETAVSGGQRIALYPTPTLDFVSAGQPRPTLTATITPTAPPQPEQPAPLPQNGIVENVCPAETFYDISAPPPGYASAGRLLVNMIEEPGNFNGILEPETGELILDDTLLDLDGCRFSFDLNWVWCDDTDLVIARPDGSDTRILYRARDRDYWPSNIRWRGLSLLEYQYEQYVSGRQYPVTFIQQIDPNSSITPLPVEPTFRPDVYINRLNVSEISWQPGLEQRFVVVHTEFNTGRTIGYKYYIYDTATQEALYFAREADYPQPTEIQFEWHPLGYALYYRYLDDAETWYLFDPQTRQHYRLGDLPGGEWSRDGRYRVDWTQYTPEEHQLWVEQGAPLPRIQIWDRETGLLRRYCLPQTGELSVYSALNWSPEQRYLILQYTLPADEPYPGAPTRTFALDLQTGYLTQITTEPVRIVVWMGEPTGAGGQ